MKILAFLINLVPYHVARWNAVAKVSGNEVSVVQMRSQDEFSVLEATGAKLNFSLSTLGLLETSMSSGQIFDPVAEAINSSCPDVIVISGYSFPISLAALKFGCENGIPVVICSESNRDDFRRRWYIEAIKKRVIQLCSAGLVGARPQKEYLCELGLHSTQIFEGYNVVDNKHFVRRGDDSRKNRMALRSSLGLPTDFFIAVARFTEKKNLDGLIESYCLLVESEGQSVPDLVILGDGPLRQLLESMIAKRGLGSKIHLLGAVSYELLPSYYALAKVFIHTSKTEQWGLVVNEAMAVGLPVIVSDRCGCARDLVLDGENGFSFSPDRPKELTQLLRRCVRMEREDLERLADRGRRIISNWGPDRFASGVGDAIQKALEVGPRRLSLVDRILLKFLAKR